MAVAQFYGMKAEAAEVARSAPRILVRRDFGAVAALARAISGAGGACIRLAHEGAARVTFYPPRAGVADLPAALLRGETAGTLAEELGAAGLAGLQFWAGFPLKAPGGEVLGLLGVLDDQPRALTQAMIGQLQMLADVLAGEVLLAEAAVTVSARRSLRLIEDVVELDDSAASPVLRGLLRFAAGEAPHSTEALALRIAGLAEAKAGKLVLTAVAEGILAQQGYETGPAEAELEAGTADEAAGAEAEFSPMARLRIGERFFDVARSEAIEALAFRVAGSDAAWQVLENGLEEGWPEIIAEVLRGTRNVVLDYVRMHMIHDRDAGLPEGEYRYDLYGMGWTVRGTPAHAEVSVNGTDWVAFDASGVAWDQPRDLSARAALAGYPDIGARIGADVHEWCKRIAAGSEVTPIF